MATPGDIVCDHRLITDGEHYLFCHSLLLKEKQIDLLGKY